MAKISQKQLCCIALSQNHTSILMSTDEYNNHWDLVLHLVSVHWNVL
jgi:hypothetical protein